MFFIVSKVFWFVAVPGNLLLLLLALGVMGLFTKWMRAARGLLVASLVLLVLAGQAPLGVWLLRPLEDRFARPGQDMSAPTGIVVLGGGVDDIISRARGTMELSPGGARMTEAAALMHRFPTARLVFTGGSAALIGSDGTEADIARLLFPALGIAPERIAYEERSRNTWENAAYTRELVNPKPGETWLLVTSASHMPRSVGVFRKADFPVIPYPASYSTTGAPWELIRPTLSTVDGLAQTERALREYVGLIAYWLSGRSSALFPGP